MKHSKMSRWTSVGLSILLAICSISLNSYAENDVEILPDEEEYISLDESNEAGDELFGEDIEFLMDDADVVGGDGSIADDDVIICDPEEIIIDSSVTVISPGTEGSVSEEAEIILESQDEVVEAEDEEVISENSEVNVAEGSEILTLNYDAYTLQAVGDTVLLTATIADAKMDDDVETATEEALTDEVAILDEEKDSVENAEYSSVIDSATTTQTELDGEILVESVSETENGVFWISSDETVATVNEMGVVTAVACGETVITCMLKSDEEVTATCVVTVAAGCSLQEHVHSREECYVRVLTCSHTSEDEHTYECFLNKFVCGMEEHIHNDECFSHTDSTAQR